ARQRHSGDVSEQESERRRNRACRKAASSPGGEAVRSEQREPPEAARASQLLTDLADARLLADAVAEVVELRAVDVADRLHVDLVDLGRMQGERALDPDAGRLLAHRERLAHARSLALDHDALEHLDPLP